MASTPFSFNSRRSAVHSSKGIVACSQPLAAQAGLDVLNKGGNAVDAAVAAAATLNVTEPSSCGIGGDAFVLFWDAKAKTIRGVNGSGRAPAALTTSFLRAQGITGDNIPFESVHGVTVPGAPAAFIDALDWYGSKKVDRETVFAPAIRIAEEGYPVSEVSATQWKSQEARLQNQSPNGGEMLRPDNKAPAEGEIMKLPYLANSYRELATKGKDGYYRGRIAEEIVNVIKSKGGVMTLEDLASHTTEQVKPISYTYKSAKASDGQHYTLSEIPPNGQGITALIALGILDQLQQEGKVKFEQDSVNSVSSLHAMIEALRLAFADTRSYVADPQVEKVPVEELLSEAYLKKRASEFDPEKCRADISKGSPWTQSDTVYLTTSDSEGNACSFIYSNYEGFGTGIIPKHCGFTLQNRGCNFTLQDGHPNNIGEDTTQGKRPYHTIIPAMVTKGDELFMSYGVMGGFMQPQGHLQVLLNTLHFQQNAQQALDTLRFCITPDFYEHKDETGQTHQYMSSQTFIEDGIPDAVIQGLIEKGHNIKVLKGYSKLMFGKGQVIKYGTDQHYGKMFWAAGSDPRADGQAVAQF